MASVFERFPYGGAAFALLLLAVGSGAYIAAQPIPKRTATLTFWTFAKPHYESYKKAIPEFERTHPGVTVDLQLVAGEATGQRLRAAFWSNLDVPDMVETEIGTAGTFFRGSLANIGFVDLTDRIKSEGWDKKMVESRFSSYTTRGRIFGLPHDVHPVQIAYRKDLFDKEGVDLAKVETWDEFIALGNKITRTTGSDKRYIIEMGDTAGIPLDCILFQKGGNYFDAAGNCVFDDEIGVETVKWYIPLVAGEKRIANALGYFGAETNQAVETGYIMSLFAPDWRTKGIQNDVAAVKGKMALMPIPAFTKGGRRTSTGGGTMMGITKASKNQDLAWEFAKFLYTNNEDLATRFAETNIIPPVKAAWNLPEFKEPNEFYSNQPLGTTFADLAPQVPPQYGSPFLGTAKAKMGEAVVACVSYYKANGDKGFDAYVRKTMKEKADYVRLVMTRNPDYDKAQAEEAARVGAGTATK
ncbi:MAG: extracellular solute-binding protein [Fibrella sp.]|nr:extracellular solute-binding protein [Armatimonadota bacterium]